MASGQGCFDITVEFVIRKVIGAQNAIAVDVFHSNQKSLAALDNVSEGIETFITAIGDEDCVRSSVTIDHGIKSSPFVKLFFALKDDIMIGVVQKVIEGIDVDCVVTSFSFMN